MRNDRWERENPGIEVFDVEAAPARSRSARRPRKRHRGGVNWRPISLLAVAVLAAVAVFALADRPTPVPIPPDGTANATPLATPDLPAATADAASASPGFDPSWRSEIDLPLITVPADVVRVATRQADAWVSPPGSASGPLIYGTFGGATDAVSVFDLGTGTKTALPFPLKPGEAFGGARTDGTWLAVEVAEQGMECGPTMRWRLLVARVGPDGIPAGGARAFSQVASGTSIGRKLPDQLDCLVTRQPLFDVVAGRLAWVEEPSGNRGSAVRLRALDRGRTVSYTSRQYAVDLALSADAVAWVESSDPAAWATLMQPSSPGAVRPDWQVMEVGPTDSVPHSVDIGVSGRTGSVPLPGIALNGTVLVATLRGQDMNPQAVVEVGDTRLRVIDDASHGRFCATSGAINGMVLLTCYWPAITMVGTGQGGSLSLGATWTPSSGLRAFTVGADQPAMAYGVLVSPGWVVLMGDGKWTAVPISALSSP